MKRLLLSIILLAGFGLTTVQVSAQTKMEKKAMFFAEEAAKEFGLNDKRKDKVYEAKLQHMKATQEVMKQKRAGEFEDEETFKATKKETLKPLNDELMGLLGVKGKDFWDFNKATNQKMKDIE